MIRRALTLALAGLFAGAPALAQDRDALIAQGKRVFLEQGCYGCHTVGTMGTPIGPDFSRLGLRYEERALARWLRDPSAERPTAHMPKLNLSEAEVQALAAYLSSLK